MKKLLFILMMTAASLSVRAADYSYLTFETTDGGKVSVSVASLTLTVSGTTLTAGSQTFTLANLEKMYFSSSDETTGISSITAADLDEVSEVYDLRGRRVAKDAMRSGEVYIVKTRKGTSKITVK